MNLYCVKLKRTIGIQILYKKAQKKRQKRIKRKQKRRKTENEIKQKKEINKKQ